MKKIVALMSFLFSFGLFAQSELYTPPIRMKTIESETWQGMKIEITSVEGIYTVENNLTVTKNDQLLDSKNWTVVASGVGLRAPGIFKRKFQQDPKAPNIFILKTLTDPQVFGFQYGLNSKSKRYEISEQGGWPQGINEGYPHYLGVTVMGKIVEFPVYHNVYHVESGSDVFVLSSGKIILQNLKLSQYMYPTFLFLDSSLEKDTFTNISPSPLELDEVRETGADKILALYSKSNMAYEVTSDKKLLIKDFTDVDLKASKVLDPLKFNSGKVQTIEKENSRILGAIELFGDKPRFRFYFAGQFGKWEYASRIFKESPPENTLMKVLVTYDGKPREEYFANLFSGNCSKIQNKKMK